MGGTRCRIYKSVSALENVLDPKWEPLKAVADQVEADNFGLCLDIGHANCYSAQPVEDWAQGLNPYLTHIHVHDNHGDRDAHLALGDGNLKWEKIQEIFMQEEKRRRETGCKKELTYTKKGDAKKLNRVFSHPLSIAIIQ